MNRSEGWPGPLVPDHPTYREGQHVLEPAPMPCLLAYVTEGVLDPDRAPF